jgi:histone arginine demethylase JMJD6
MNPQWNRRRRLLSIQYSKADLCGRKSLQFNGEEAMKFEIERRQNLSYEDFARDYLYPLKPVIVTDVLEKWPAMKRWTPEFFKREFGDMTFRLNENLAQRADYRGNEEGTEYTMARFIDRVLSSTEENPAPYFRNRVLHDMFPSLKYDIEPLPPYFQPNWLPERYLVTYVEKVLNRGAAIELYIGGKGSAFPVLHYDGAGTHAFLMHIYGRKEFIIYPPEQEPFLYPSPEKVNLSSITDLANPDLARFPSFSRAVATKFVLEPGEMLFVPSHWWHTTKMLSPSITVSINVLNQSNWHELVKFVAINRRNPLVSLASRVYLSGAGAWRSWRDRDWRRRVYQRPA